ncbi:MAG: hypothetical protein WC807_17530 [Hyphomicrobium sp.]|jgi:hypothetical protein
MLAPLLLAVVGAIVASVVVEIREPLHISSAGWMWAMRTVHLASFFLMSLLVVGLIKSVF